ncbi:hypothetical protein AAFP35_17800 [Gordonia sp. CPCC 206044]|uniref:hypothetical protein n=1 Tax=Gordonia sp. CPCC 206044 TaxID=3140793 RepID=UPI003AF347D1
MAWLGRIGVGSTYLGGVSIPMALIGVGQGLAVAPMAGSGVTHVDASDARVASGLLSTGRELLLPDQQPTKGISWASRS